MRITMRRQGQRVWMQARGDFDLFVREPFLIQVQSLIEDGMRELQLDLSRVHFLGSTGVSALLRARRVLTGRGGSLQVGPTSTEARESLEQLGLAQLLLGPERRAG